MSGPPTGTGGLRIDLHTHTNFSDGDLSPEALVRRAISRRVGVLSITDHDSVDALPLAFEERVERPAPAKAAKPGAGGVNAAPAAEEKESALARLGGEIWRELRQLVVVRRIDAPEPPLIAPPQAWFLRENLKLRLLNARLALLTRDEAGYREDLRVSQAWIQRYFDARAKASQAALAQLKQLSSASVGFEPPSIADSLEAVRGFKSRRERTN